MARGFGDAGGSGDERPMRWSASSTEWKRKMRPRSSTWNSALNFEESGWNATRTR